MRVIRATAAGFCQGVRRAVALAESAARTAGGASVFTDGPLIHNEREIARLEALGVKSAAPGFSPALLLRESPAPGGGRREAPEEERGNVPGGERDDVPPPPVVVLRAHGVAPARRDEFLRAGVRIVDATCPHVRRIQKIVQTATASGRTVLVLGDPKHPEVKALLGFTAPPQPALRTSLSVNTLSKGEAVSRPPSHGDGLPQREAVSRPPHAAASVCVLSSSSDLDRTDLPAPPFTLVAQSTQPEALFRETAAALLARFPDSEIRDTVCGATQARQEALAELAGRCDAIVVVGSRTSANSRHLAERAAELRPSFFVSGPDELDAAALAGFETVGVTAGASTPDSAIAAVESRLATL